REVQRHALEPARSRPLDRFAHEPLVEAVRRLSQARHRRERQSSAAARQREMEKAVRPLVGAEPDDEDRIVDMEQSIQRHHETALRLAAAPSARDLLELSAELAADFVRPEDAAAE